VTRLGECLPIDIFIFLQFYEFHKKFGKLFGLIIVIKFDKICSFWEHSGRSNDIVDNVVLNYNSKYQRIKNSESE
jgi:hypothetical protein